MTIVDSSVWIDALGGLSTVETRWLDAHLADVNLALTDLILCETLQGIRDDATFRRTRENLMGFAVLSVSGAELALASAQNYRLLRKRGITIRSAIDCLIATFCIEGGHSLLHRDRDFDAFEKHLGLSVIHP